MGTAAESKHHQNITRRIFQRQEIRGCALNADCETKNNKVKALPFFEAQNAMPQSHSIYTYRPMPWIGR